MSIVMICSNGIIYYNKIQVTTYFIYSIDLGEVKKKKNE